jgi:hypothetical protein
VVLGWLAIVTLGMFFYSTAVAILGVVEEGTLKTSLTVLGRVLLILIFVELLATIGTIVREREVVAERGVPGPRSSDLGPKGVVRLSTENRGRCALRRSAFSSPDNPARVLSRQPTRPARGRLSVGPSEVIYPVRGRR